MVGATAGFALAGSSLDVDAPLPSVVFIKTKKTASGTIANIVSRMMDALGREPMLPGSPLAHPNSLSGGGTGWAPLSVPVQLPVPSKACRNATRQYDSLLHHAVLRPDRIAPHIRHRNGRSPVWFSIVREPTAQATSAMAYFGFQSLARRKFDWPEHLRWLQRLKSVGTVSSLFVNPQAHDLGWYDHRSAIESDQLVGQHISKPRDLDSNANAIGAFLEKVDAQLDLVMLTEAIDEGLVVLQRILGCALEALVYVPHKMAEKPYWWRPMGPPNASERATLQRTNAVDETLYAHFRQRFWARWNALEPRGRDRDLARLRALNAAAAARCGSKSEDLRNQFLSSSDLCPALLADELKYTRHFVNRFAHVRRSGGFSGCGCKCRCSCDCSCDVDNSTSSEMNTHYKILLYTRKEKQITRSLCRCVPADASTQASWTSPADDTPVSLYRRILLHDGHGSA